MTRNDPSSEGVGQAITGLLSLLFIAGCSASPSPSEPPVRPVKTLVVSAGGENRVRSFPGKVEAARSAELAFQVSGLLVRLPVKEGQRVAKGDVIAELRKDEFQARLKALQGKLDQGRATLTALRQGERPEQQLRLEAQVRAAEVKLANARSEYTRLRNIRDKHAGAVARADLERAETAYRVAQEDHQAAIQLLEKGTIARVEDLQAQEAAVRGLEGQVVEAKIQLDDCTLRAPYDGVVARRFVEEKENVKAKQPIVSFQDVDEILVAVEVPESIMAADLRSADIVQLQAEFGGAPGRQFPVRISEVAQQADPVTQTFTVRAAMQAPTGLNLLPGMTASVELTYRRASILGSRMLVPIAAIHMEAGGEQVVWVIGTDQSVRRRPVKTGEATGSQIEVLDGLQPGDRIAVAGVSFLRDGMKVNDLGNALGGG